MDIPPDGIPPDGHPFLYSPGARAPNRGRSRVYSVRPFFTALAQGLLTEAVTRVVRWPLFLDRLWTVFGHF